MKKTPPKFQNCVELQAALFVQSRTAIQELTGREKAVAVMVWLQFSDKAIMDELGMGRSTLREHMTNLFIKLAVKTRIGVVLAYERSLHPAPGKLFPWKIMIRK